MYTQASQTLNVITVLHKRSTVSDCITILAVYSVTMYENALKNCSKCQVKKIILKKGGFPYVFTVLFQRLCVLGCDLELHVFR